MKRIELDPYEEKDLRNYLHMLIKLLPKREDYITNGNDGWISKEYHIIRINHFLDLLDGKIMSNGYLRTTAKEIEDKNKSYVNQKYRHLKEEDYDLLDILDNYLMEKENENR